jgi:hypothetical protein
MDQVPASLSWHEELIRNVFSSLSKTVRDEVGLDQLEASFAKMQIPIDEATFTRYACELLPRGADCVNYQEFLAFHKAVWANQPASVRRYAGDPSAVGSDAFTGSVANRRLLRSSSVPSGGSLRELRSNEGVLRSAFKRYEQSPGYLDRGQLPALFQDVGLDLGINTDVDKVGSTRLHSFLNSEFKRNEADDKVSLHDVVEMQNKYIAALEGEKRDRKSQSIVYPNYSTDVLIRQSMESALTSRPPSAVKREAALQEKVAMVGEFSNRVADARGRGGNATSSGSTPCLYYFPMAARGEVIRMTAVLGGMALDDMPVVADKKEASGSLGTPSLVHGELKFSDTCAVQEYVANMAPNFSTLTPEQQAVDNQFFKVQEDFLQDYEKTLDSETKVDEEVPKICAKWLPFLEGMLPSDGFVHGLAYPTPADFAVLMMIKGFMPFGALNKKAGFDPLATYTKFAAHVNRVASYPAVQAYLETSATIEGNPFGI